MLFRTRLWYKFDRFSMKTLDYQNVLSEAESFGRGYPWLG